MSLTRLLRNDDVIRGLFKTYFEKPRLPPGPDMQAPPKTENYAMVGTAFDYLLRFEVARLNGRETRAGRQRRWVAASAVQQIRDPKLQQQAQEMVETARKRRARYVSTGTVTDGLLRSVIELARLDPIFRAGRGHGYIGAAIEPGDIGDLRQLLAIVPRDRFIAKERYLLNPTMGSGTMLVQGADADVIIDDRIIDVKTTKNWTVRRRAFNQLLGYYTLLCIDHIEHEDLASEIEQLTIYFSRHGVMHTYPIGDLIDEARFQEFRERFEKRCNQRCSPVPSTGRTEER